MDPDINLNETLQLAKRFILMSQMANDTVTYDENEVTRLSELIVSLDEWISKGGFLPQRWTDGTKTRRTPATSLTSARIPT